MTKEDDIKSSYFCFLMDLIGYENKNNPYENFGVLLIFLNSIEYQWDNPMDENRMYDGLNLRYLYSLDSEYDYNDILDTLDTPCSILEMLIALSYKIEVDIACNPDYINRTGKWFWFMINSLGLGDMTDAQFDENKVIYIMQNFISRNYNPNGNGGLFTISDNSIDMRTMDLWYQANTWLNENINLF